MFQNKHCRSKGENTMKTPLEYTKNLKNHIITPQMLLDCLYSSNKRAKIGEIKNKNIVNFIVLADILMINMITRQKQEKRS